MIEIENITKVYQMGEIEVHALRGVSLRIEAGEWAAIMGPSAHLDQVHADAPYRLPGYADQWRVPAGWGRGGWYDG